MTDRTSFNVHAPDTFWAERWLPTPVLLLAEGVVIAATFIAGVLGQPWWIGAIIGAVLAIPTLVRSRGNSVAHRISARMGFIRRRMRRPEFWYEPPFDVPLAEGGSCGVRWDGDRLITMVRIEANPRAVTRFAPGRVITDDVVPLDLIAECLHQFDIELESADIVSHGSRAYGNGNIARIYSQILGPLPATAFRSVTVVLRLNPLANADAIERRGGGPTGVLRTAIVATRRVANRLSGKGHAATILTAAEINSVFTALMEGTSPDDLVESWDHVQVGSMHSHNYRLDQTALSDPGLGAPWTVPSLSTVLTLHLRPAENHEVHLSALARFNTLTADPVPVPEGFHPCNGHQRDAYVAGLPLADPFDDRAQMEYLTTRDSLAAVALPAAGCGQLVGADEEGRAVALSLVGSSVRTVEIAGTLNLCQQVVLRAIALGARVMVSTDRPADWMPMAHAVGDPRTLAVAGAAAGSQVAGQRQGYSVLVFDGVAQESISAEATIITVTAPGLDAQPGADVALLQDADVGPWVMVRSGTEASPVVMVATDDEMRYIGSSLNAPDRQLSRHRR
ncbi:type VII secretion protein EccE [Gordonia sp. SID5947]|uniref:type VII secretion protein EccE n=1 Tax=Gordonia sp. SID5947 TaxID=2690315 RepID=UPI0013698607|nr:type VII secretion protein EccE [Gordonia sp. SID5947]